MLKKIYAALFALTLISITLTTSVYAWFNTSKSSLVDGVEMGVGEDDNLYLSLDGINYQKNITPEMLREHIGRTTRLTNITSPDGKTFYASPTSTRVYADPRTEYLTFDIYFKVVTDNPNEAAHQKYVYLADRKTPSFELAPNTKGTFVVSRGVNWTSPIDFNDGDIYVTAGENRLYHASNAVRIGVVNDEQELSFIYDPSENEARGYGKLFGALDYYERRLGVRLVPPEAPNNMIYRLSNFSPLQDDIALDKVSLVAETILVNEVDGIYEYRGHAKVSIWIEGWDPDSMDAIQADILLISLRFKAARFEN